MHPFCLVVTDLIPNLWIFIWSWSDSAHRFYFFLNLFSILISETFSFWLKSLKRFLSHCPEHYPPKEKLLRVMIWQILDKVTKSHFQSTSNKVIWPPKKLKIHAGVKKCHFGNFLEGPGWLHPISAALKNPLLDLKIHLCLGCRWIPSNAGRPN